MYSVSLQGFLALPLYLCHMAMCLTILKNIRPHIYIPLFIYIYVIMYIFLLLLTVCMMTQMVHFMFANIVDFLTYDTAEQVMT